MNRDGIDSRPLNPCKICKHERMFHKTNAIGSITCFACVYMNNSRLPYNSSYAHEFVLDNLALIEQLAEERGLV